MKTQTLHYDLYQMDENNHWQRIYRNLDFLTAKHNLCIELAEPTQKDKWKVREVVTTTQEREFNPYVFLVFNK